MLYKTIRTSNLLLSFAKPLLTACTNVIAHAVQYQQSQLELQSQFFVVGILDDLVTCHV